MDERLSYWRGARVGRLRKSDLPPVALALVAQVYGMATAWRLEIENQDMVRVYSEAGYPSVYIRGEDWVKILPYVQSGFFTPTVVPSGDALVPVPDVVVLDQTRRKMYERVYGTLVALFPEDYPTSTY